MASNQEIVTMERVVSWWFINLIEIKYKTNALKSDVNIDNYNFQTEKHIEIGLSP